jgi:hypothetical protein
MIDLALLILVLGVVLIAAIVDLAALAAWLRSRWR